MLRLCALLWILKLHQNDYMKQRLLLRQHRNRRMDCRPGACRVETGNRSHRTRVGSDMELPNDRVGMDAHTVGLDDAFEGVDELLVNSKHNQNGPHCREHVPKLETGIELEETGVLLGEMSNDIDVDSADTDRTVDVAVVEDVEEIDIDCVYKRKRLTQSYARSRSVDAIGKCPNEADVSSLTGDLGENIEGVAFIDTYKFKDTCLPNYRYPSEHDAGFTEKCFKLNKAADLNINVKRKQMCLNEGQVKIGNNEHGPLETPFINGTGASTCALKTLTNREHSHTLPITDISCSLKKVLVLFCLCIVFD